MNFQALERAVARLEKVLLFLRGATQEELAGQVKVYSEWLSSYQETGICLHPDRTAFNKFVEHVKQAEDCQRRNAIEDGLAAAFEGMRDLASPELRAARRKNSTAAATSRATGGRCSTPRSSTA